jgi:hypothetical protein
MSRALTFRREDGMFATHVLRRRPVTASATVDLTAARIDVRHTSNYDQGNQLTGPTRGR